MKDFLEIRELSSYDKDPFFCSRILKHTWNVKQRTTNHSRTQLLGSEIEQYNSHKRGCYPRNMREIILNAVNEFIKNHYAYLPANPNFMKLSDWLNTTVRNQWDGPSVISANQVSCWSSFLTFWSDRIPHVNEYIRSCLLSWSYVT